MMQEDSAIKELDLQDFLTNGILKEKVFREQLANHDWSQYNDQYVLVKGCGAVPIPTWAYMLVTTYLIQNAKKVMYGEPCSAIPIYRR